METVKTLCQNRILAILRGIYGETALRTAEALCCGGVRTVEVTFEADRPETWEQTAETLQLLNREFGQQLLLGAGTVLTCRQVTLAAQAGAQLAVAPNTDAAVIRAALEAGLCPLPGAMTPTEIAAAQAAGAAAVKVFPAGLLGPAYFQAVSTPLSGIPLFAFGGVTEHNAAAFLAAGAAGIGVSSTLAGAHLAEAGAFDEIRQNAAALCRAVFSDSAYPGAE